MAKVLVIGGGGREHAIVSAFQESSHVSRIYAAPGNPGMTLSRSKNQKIPIELLKANTLKDIYNIVLEKHIDLVFVGPEQYIEQGIADYLEDKGVEVIAPNRQAARLESSKIFAKELMSRYDIPTASYTTVTNIEYGRNHLKNSTYPVVLKADGLAAGKGVFIAENRAEAEKALISMMEDKVFGSAGEKVIIEDYLTGWEASIFAVTDGKDYKLTIFSQDHKKLSDGDKGPNTGGMGAYAPVDKAQQYLETVDETIFKTLFSALKSENIEYRGILYAGLIFTETGPKVLEFNCRLGDPETQVLLPLLENDIWDICTAITKREVCNLELRWLPKYAVNVVVASQGYPGSYQKGSLITISDKIFNDNDIEIFFAGVANKNSEGSDSRLLVNSGGRVLSITALGDTLDNAIRRAYDSLQLIYFDGMYYRTDIAAKAYI